MALVREFVTELGVTVRVMDDCYAGISAEELARRRHETARAIHRISLAAARIAADLTPPATATAAPTWPRR